MSTEARRARLWRFFDWYVGAMVMLIFWMYVVAPPLLLVWVFWALVRWTA